MRGASLCFMPSVSVPSRDATSEFPTPLLSRKLRPPFVHRTLRPPVLPSGWQTRVRASARPPSTRQGTSEQVGTQTASGLASEQASPLYDVIVIGAGPAGLSLAASLGLEGLSVCCVDGALDKPWPNHYGVWMDEFTRVGYEECASASYDTTVVHAGGGSGGRISLPRAYLRVDRVMLKKRLMEQCAQTDVKLMERFVKSVRHDCAQWSDVVVSTPNAPSGEAEANLRARLVFDCTGHAVAFTKMDEGRALNPRLWYQAAYGIEAEVRSYPFGKDEMVLMDFRDEHVKTVAGRADSAARPTFLYVFPSGERRAFFEETSIILKEALSFDELKTRLYNRLRHQGVEVTRVIEEEFSLIPMGGALPDFQQRVVAFGGAALLVHPATGYMVGRTVRLARGLAKRVAGELGRAGEGGDMERASHACWDEVWGLATRRQRDFLIFGAELLESLDMDEMRAFFVAFFALPLDLWSRFLGYELDGPLWRLRFAVTFFVVADNRIRLRLLWAMVDIGRWRMVRSVLPEWLTAHQE